MLTLELLKKELAVATLQQKLGKEVSIPCIYYTCMCMMEHTTTDSHYHRNLHSVDKSPWSQIISSLYIATSI